MLNRWAEADLTGGRVAPTDPSIQALSRWVGADLTAAGVAPPGQSVQGLGWWVGAGPDGGWANAGFLQSGGRIRVRPDLTEVGQAAASSYSRMGRSGGLRPVCGAGHE
ncbi:hypothetical protein GCM10010483_26850 [Actinokineospora diospyrosa]